MKISINQLKTLIKNIISENNSRLLKNDKEISRKPSESIRKKTNEAAEDVVGGGIFYDQKHTAEDEERSVSRSIREILKDKTFYILGFINNIEDNEVKSALNKLKDKNSIIKETDLVKIQTYLNGNDFSDHFAGKFANYIMARNNDLELISQSLDMLHSKADYINSLKGSEALSFSEEEKLFSKKHEKPIEGTGTVVQPAAEKPRQVIKVSIPKNK
jgi:hypothetical protein